MESYRRRRLIIYVMVIPVLLAGRFIIKSVLPQKAIGVVVSGWCGILLTAAYLIARPTRDELQLEKLRRANREDPPSDDDL